MLSTQPGHGHRCRLLMKLGSKGDDIVSIQIVSAVETVEVIVHLISQPAYSRLQIRRMWEV